MLAHHPRGERKDVWNRKQTKEDEHRDADGSLVFIILSVFLNASIVLAYSRIGTHWDGLMTNSAVFVWWDLSRHLSNKLVGFFRRHVFDLLCIHHRTTSCSNDRAFEQFSFKSIVQPGDVTPVQDGEIKSGIRYYLNGNGIDDRRSTRLQWLTDAGDVCKFG